MQTFLQPTLIRNKKQYKALAARGLCGNSPLTWDSADEFLATSDDQMVGLRSYKRADQRCNCQVPRMQLRSVIKRSGFKPGEYFLSQTFDNSVEIKFAGELTIGTDGRWYMYYSYLPLVMREALAKGGQHAYGTQVWGLLRRYCDVNSRLDLHDLFEAYSPGGRYPVIELSVTRSCYGIYPHRNTLIWEIRHY